MASNVVPRSLKRTGSRGNLTVFILIQIKVNDELLIVTREQLAPPLRKGQLNLHQKVHIILEDGDFIEGTIVYMRK